MKRRIAITGVGVVSAIGVGQQQTCEAFRRGRSGVGRVTHLSTVHKEFPVGEVKLSNEEMCRLLDIPYTDRVSRTELIGILALREALQEAGLTERHGMALVSGTTVRGMSTWTPLGT